MAERLRRTVQVRVRKIVGSNPTLVNIWPLWAVYIFGLLPYNLSLFFGGVGGQVWKDGMCNLGATTFDLGRIVIF